MAITKIEVPELFDFGSDNSAFKLPTGTTAERPTSPSNGEMRFNTTTGFVEYYDTTNAKWWEIDYEGVVPSDNFNTVLYTGNGGTQAISTVGFKPDFVWIKNIENTLGNSHFLADSVRGGQQRLSSNTAAPESNLIPYGDGVMSFDSNGFTVADDPNGDNGINGQVGGTYGSSYVAWSWKAGGTAVSNTDGTISSDVSANVAAGFSIISYTGNGVSGATVGHGLESTPELTFIKCLNQNNTYWFVPVPDIVTGKYLFLNTSSAGGTGGFAYDANNITLNNTFSDANANNNTYITYAWHSVAGYSSIGKYTGNGNSTGPIVDTGFTPRFVMIKATTNDNGGGSWLIYDSARSPSNPRNKRLYPDLGSAEQSSSSYNLDFLTGATKGFQPKDGANYYGYNTLNVEYIYMAFA